MKNVHLIPTDKPTWLHKSTLTGVLRKSSSCIDDMKQAQGMNIYITSDEEIKEGDWYLYTDILGGLHVWQHLDKGVRKGNDGQKIILTTEQDLIKDGVQAIDDEFLEWFVKNTSCEEVVIEDYGNLYNFRYLILIPKEEEVKEETLEEAVQKVANSNDFINGALFGCLWQQERMYSEEEVDFFIKEILHYIKNYNYNVNNLEMIKLSDDIEFEIEKLFEQLKNK